MLPTGVQSTAGAVPVRNEKGELSMQKVKVQRYISGKRPEYAQGSSSEAESDYEDFIDHNKKEKGDQNVAGHKSQDMVKDVDEQNDSRLIRLMSSKEEIRSEDRYARHRQIHEPTILASDESDSNEKLSVDDKSKRITLESDSESDTDLSDTEIETRRVVLRERMLKQQREEEILQKEDEKQSDTSDSEISEYEDETESEEENEPRLKPLFVRKRDRATVIEKEREATKQKQMEVENKKSIKERRRQTLRMIEETIKKEMEHTKTLDGLSNLNDVCTDDENDEVEYEAWKLRELKRIKRDREENDLFGKERLELEKMRNMTDEERRQNLRQNPKIITNKAAKGKYKFLQKYYHRGAFYLDEEEDVLKRDFAQATLDDHFDKTILPKVMQVKNFGRCGRTKYTHLVDQDTTQFESPWYSDMNVKLNHEKGTGSQPFDKPSNSKRKRP